MPSPARPDAVFSVADRDRALLGAAVGPTAAAEAERLAVRAAIASASGLGIRALGQAVPVAEGDDDAVWSAVVLAEEVGRGLPATVGLGLAAHLRVAGRVRPRTDDLFGVPLGRGLAFARRDGDLVVRGTAEFVNAHGGDAFFIGDADQAAVVPAHAHGVEVAAASTWALGADIAPIVFHDVVIRSDWRIPPNPGAADAEVEACRVAAAAERYVDAAVTYARGRTTFGAALYDHQAIRLRLAEVRTDIELVRRLAYASVAVSIDGGDSSAAAATAAAVLRRAVRVMGQAADACFEVHGARGYLEGEAPSQFARDALLVAYAHRLGSS